MSRSQPPYLPMHGRDVRSDGFDIALVPVTARSTPRRRRDNDPEVDRGGLYTPVSAPRDLEVVKGATIHVLRQIQVKLSNCRLTIAEEGMKQQIFSDLDRIAGVLLTVLRAHRDAASGIQHIIDIIDNSSRGYIVQNVQGHLTSAWSSIDTASEEFDIARNRILKQSQSLKAGTDISPSFFRRQAHKAVNYDLPGKSSYPSLCVAIISLVVNSAAAADIASRVPGAVATTNILGALAIIFGSAMQVAKYIGADAAIYEPTARETTKKALDCIDRHLLQFCRALSSLQSYWENTHSSQVKRSRVNVDPHELLRIVQLMEKHVDDCLEVVTAIQNLSGSMTVIPTQLDIYDERNGINHGVFGLPSGRY